MATPTASHKSDPKLVHYIGRTLVHPHATLAKLVADRRAHRFAAVLFASVASSGSFMARTTIRSRGRFEDLATISTWAIGVATLFTLVPDFISSALGAYATWDPTGYTWVLPSSLYLIAYPVLFPSAIRVVHGLRWRSAAGLGLAGVALFHAFFLLFVR